MFNFTVGPQSLQWACLFQQKPQLDSTPIRTNNNIAAYKRDSLERLAKNPALASLASAPIQLGVFAAAVGVGCGVMLTKFAGMVTGAGAGLCVGGVRGNIGRSVSSGARTGAAVGEALARMPLRGVAATLKTPGSLFRVSNAYLTQSQGNPIESKLLKHLDDKALLNTLFACKPQNMSLDDVKRQVYLGEQLVKSLDNGSAPTMKPSSAAVSAIVWYLTAKSVECSGEKYHRGTFNFVDPDHKLFEFMSQAPTCYGRISTHFACRSLSESGIKASLSGCGLMAASQAIFRPQPIQRGIDDFSFGQGRLPNGMRAVLFDRMESKNQLTGNDVPQTMVKLETVGMPTVCRIFGHSEHSKDILGSIGNAILALDHCVQHSINFSTPKWGKKSEEGMYFYEEVHRSESGRLLDKALKLAASETDIDNSTVGKLRNTLKEQGMDKFNAELEKEVNKPIAHFLESTPIKNQKANNDETYMQRVQKDLGKRGQLDGIAIRQGGEFIVSLFSNEGAYK